MALNNILIRQGWAGEISQIDLTAITDILSQLGYNEDNYQQIGFLKPESDMIDQQGGNFWVTLPAPQKAALRKVL